MYIYNITTNVEESIADEWVLWTKTVLIPKMLKNKKLKKATLTQVLVEEEMGGLTYSTQYFCESEEILNDFVANDLDSIKQLSNKFQGQFVDFSTKLKVLKEL